MAAVARAGPHRRVQDDEVVAHYARADDGSPGVDGTRRVLGRAGWSKVTLMHPRWALRRGLDGSGCALVAHLDAIAEIPHSLRRGTAVTLGHVPVLDP